MESRNWDIEVSETSEIVHARYHGKNGSWIFMVGALTKYNIDMFSWFPIECPEEKLNICAELLTRINHTLMSGHFEMSYQNRYIKCTTLVPYKNRFPSKILLKMMLSLNLRTMDRYFPVLKQVIELNVNPLDALTTLQNSKKTKSEEKPKSRHSIQIHKLSNKPRYRFN